MKKGMIAAVFSGVILFAWQFVSWTASGLHQSTQQYTPKQEQILKALAESGLQHGGYMLPNVPANTPIDEAEAIGKTWTGKPWASVQYHSSFQMALGSNMVRNVLANIVAMSLLCWIFMRMQERSFGTTIAASLAVGAIIFLVAPYTNFIWYKSFDVWGHLVDAFVPWLLIGAWLGWYLQDRRRSRVIYRAPEEKKVMV